MAYQSNALAGNIQGSLSGTATPDWPRWKDGRPPCPLICFGYGGRVAMMTPKAITTGAQPTYAGAIELHSLSHIPSLLSDRQRVAGFAVPAGQVDPDRAAVERFPSALSPGAGKDRLARFVSDRMDLCMEEEPHCKRPDLLRTIWGVLRVLVKNQGTLISEPTAKSSSDPEKELVELLVPEAEKGSWVGGMGSSGLLLPGPDDYRLQAVAAEVQQLLVTGKRRQALRVATEGHLWSVAVVLAHGIGPGAVSETVTAMATSSLHAGSPLRTLMLMMGGSPDALEHAGPNKGKAVVNSSASQEASQVGLMGVGAPPGLATFTPSSDPFLGDWRSNLLVLATNKVKGSREAIAKLGDRLWDEWREVESAQLCYLVAGILPQPLDAASGCRLTLVGADHRSDPRLYASVEAIQRTEVYEWAFSVAHPHHRMVDFQPYKLVYAMMLAEYGKVAEAMSYCDSVLECLRSLGKLPQSMMVCHSVARELRDRLEKHAQAFNISVYKGGSLFSSIGRALDKGIHKLIGLGDSNDQTSHEGVSKTSSLSGDAGRAPSESAAFRRAPSHASLEGSRSAQEGWFSRARGPASVPLPNNGAAAYGPVAPGTPPPPDRSSSTKNRQGGGSREDGGQASSTGRQAKGNDKGWFGMVTNMWGRPAGKAAQTAAPADEGKFYYDKENKRWVLEGEEAATPQSSVAPPPTSLNWGTPPQPGTQSPSPHPSAGLPSAGRAHARDRSLMSRYVDTFGSSASGPTAPSPMLTPPMAKLPKTPNLLLPGGGSASMPNLVGMQAQSQTSGASQVVATNEKGVKRGLLSPGQGSNGLGSNGLGGEGQGHAQAPCTYSSLIENAGNVGAKRNGPCSQGSGVGMDTGLDLLVNQSPPVRWSCAGERAGPGTAPGPLASEEFREIEL
ncbi:unnamed protein product [Ostreobium quekettii]|uniref:Sec16 Sec23-binding domain-containing protein n=1 Tax=Ostreobium quekettii TaxID=121088 RepID=A0A8S1J376_9CHLO|nr:unnamed protein product [Ostreobium quekettii]|eukprot:evm.model.scf_474.2 EVM.evm.TU.scf_474.2   scf_474:23180-32724(-)